VRIPEREKNREEVAKRVSALKMLKSLRFERGSGKDDDPESPPPIKKKAGGRENDAREINGRNVYEPGDKPGNPAKKAGSDIHSGHVEKKGKLKRGKLTRYKLVASARDVD